MGLFCRRVLLLLFLAVILCIPGCDDLRPAFFTLTMDTVGAGEVTPAAGEHVYERNEVVVLTAAPAKEHVFTKWVGPVADEDQEMTTVTMNGNHTVVAHFAPEEPDDVTITELKAENGRITLQLSEELSAAPDLLYFEAQYSMEPVIEGETIVDHKAAKPGEQDISFSPLQLTGLHWSETERNQVIILFDPFLPFSIEHLYLLRVRYQDGDFMEAGEPFSVPAEGDENLVVLTMDVQGQGDTSPKAGRYYYTKGQEVLVKAFPHEGSLFQEWVGDVQDTTQDITTVVMDQDKLVTAIFTAETYTLLPGEICTVIGGIQIGAPSDAFRDELKFSFAYFEDPRGSIPLPQYYEHGVIVSDFYGIAALERIELEKCLMLGMPVPEGHDPGDLDFLVLWSMAVESYPPQDTSRSWLRHSASYDEEEELIVLTIPALDLEPHIITLAQGLVNRPEEMKTHTDSLFEVFCIGLDPEECRQAREITEAALHEAYQEFQNLGFEDLLLERQRDCSFFNLFCSDGAFEYELRDPGTSSSRGVYTIIRDGSGIAINGQAATLFRPTYSQELLAEIAVHELFHAAQHAFPEYANSTETVWDLLEGTANLAAGALRPSERRPRIDPLAIGYSLLSETQLNITYADSSYGKYQTQDFWAYLGLMMEGENPTGPSFLLDVFTVGATKSDIGNWLATHSTFSDLGTAYWEWAKNHSFEKQVLVGENDSGEAIPLGDPGQWSGHGVLQHGTYFPDGTSTGGLEDEFKLDSLSSKAYKITFVEDHIPYVVDLSIVTGDPAIHFKIYQEDLNFLDPLGDNVSREFTVGSTGLEVYVLLSNLNPDEESAYVRLLVQRQVYFADTTLEKVIREAINKPHGPILTGDLVSLTELIHDGSTLQNGEDPIRDLAGIEFVVNLERLSLMNHALEDVHVLHQLRNLEHLDLKYNRIRDLEIYGLPRLQYLNMQDNHLESITLHDLPALRFLDAKALDGHNHHLHTIQIFDLPQLAYCDLSNNQISHEAFHRFSNLPQLTDVILNNNAITELDFLAHLTSIQYLHLHTNSISDLTPLRTLLDVRYLNLSNNTRDTALMQGIPTIESLSPLVENAHNGGLGRGDRVDLYNSIRFFNREELEKDIHTLMTGYGVEVFWSTTIEKYEKLISPILADYIEERMWERIHKVFGIPLEPHIPFSYHTPLYDVPDFAPVLFEHVMLEPQLDTIFLYRDDIVVLYPYHIAEDRTECFGQFIIRRTDGFPLNQMQILLYSPFYLSDEKVLQETLFIPVTSFIGEEDYLKIEPQNTSFPIALQ